MVTGAGVLVAGTLGALVLVAVPAAGWAGTAIVWGVIGVGTALVVTPTGKVLRASVPPNRIPEVFAAQFSLSHLAWLVTYPVAGRLGTAVGLAPAWTVLAALAVTGAVGALLLWPRHDADVPVEEVEPAESVSPSGTVGRRYGPAA
ncbi:hypothetical protein ACFW3Z_25430 [Nocardiopsis alba]